MDIRPNHTIYINNLNEKIKKDGEYNCFPCTVKINETGLSEQSHSADPDQTEQTKIRLSRLKTD